MLLFGCDEVFPTSVLKDFERRRENSESLYPLKDCLAVELGPRQVGPLWNGGFVTLLGEALTSLV